MGIVKACVAPFEVRIKNAFENLAVHSNNNYLYNYRVCGIYMVSDVFHPQNSSSWLIQILKVHNHEVCLEGNCCSWCMSRLHYYLLTYSMEQSSS